VEPAGPVIVHFDSWRESTGNAMTQHGMRPLLATLLMTLALSPSASAAMSALDPSFGDGGVSITPTPLQSWNGEIYSLAEDSQGRLVATGWGESSFGVIRYLADGSLDLSFVKPFELPEAPYVPGVPWRANFNGLATAFDVAIQSDGRIVLAGFTGLRRDRGIGGFAIARFAEDGQLDPGFGGDGRVVTAVGSQYHGGAFSVDVQEDGKVLVAGIGEAPYLRTEGVLIRYLEDGGVDKGFGRRGRVHFTPRPGARANLREVAVLPSGKILVAGAFDGRFMLARLLPDGRLDRAFGSGDGIVLTDVDGNHSCPGRQCVYLNGLALHQRGIFVVGSFATDQRNYAVLARYRLSGRLDRRFGKEGFVRVRHGGDMSGEGVAIQPNGRVTVAGGYARRGSRQIAVLRFLQNGRPDLTFGQGGLFTRRLGYDSTAFTALVQPEGKVVVGGFVTPKPPLPEGLAYSGQLPHYTLLRFR